MCRGRLSDAASFSFFIVNWLFSRESNWFLPCRFSISKLDSLFLLDKNCSAWQQKVKDPFWHPYKRITGDEPSEEVLDDEDETLKML